ncbi:TonB-dependent receptor plug domain-containing protein [Polaribacter marinivivus]|uniref:TonB-dependent receptor plug domain-containing protein n=1 Tax=Polaribacter TaxID=52959 RepID=UPI003D33965B
MKKINTFLTILILFFTVSFSAQEKENIKLTIAVKDVNNNPVPGAVILIDNVKQKRVANSAGYFKVKLDKTPKEITAYSPLFGVKKVAYTGKNNIIINLVNGNKDFVSSTTNTKVGGAIQFRDIYDYLRGKVAGVNVSVGNIITIRGNNSINGNNTPLYILNGVQVGEETFANIVPTTIISVKVLKGPETAVYGMRGAAGVIEVKTSIE